MSIILPSFAGIAKPSGGGGGGVYSNNVSLSCDGTNDFLQLASTTTLAASSGWTVSFWIKFDTKESVDIIGSDTDNHSLRLFPISATTYAYIDANGLNANVNTATVLNTTDWYHVVFVDDSTNITVYIGGSSKGTMGSKGDFKVREIAKQMFSGTYLDGLIDEVAIWNTNLTASNVSTIYNSGVPGDISSLNPLSWWRMGDGTGDTDSGGGSPGAGDTVGTVADQGSGSNNGTGTNGATYSGSVPS